MSSADDRTFTISPLASQCELCPVSAQAHFQPLDVYGPQRLQTELPEQFSLLIVKRVAILFCNILQQTSVNTH